MTHAAIKNVDIIEELPLKLNIDFDEDAFFEFCQLNRELRIERDQNGTIYIMTPEGFVTSTFNSEVSAELTN